MVVFAWVLALPRQRTYNSPMDHYLALVVWVLSRCDDVDGDELDVPIAIVVLPAFAARLRWRLARAAPMPVTQPAPERNDPVLLAIPDASRMQPSPEVVKIADNAIVA